MSATSLRAKEDARISAKFTLLCAGYCFGKEMTEELTLEAAKYAVDLLAKDGINLLRLQQAVHPELRHQLAAVHKPRLVKNGD